MDQAVVALLGALGGSIATGGAQIIVGWTGRRNDSLAAARLMFGALVAAELELDVGQERSAFVPRHGRTRLFEAGLATWESQKDRLARVVNVVEFNTIQAAVFDLQHLDDVVHEAVQTGLPDGGYAAIVGDKAHAARVENITEAREVVTKAGLTTWERLRKDKYLKEVRAMARSTQPEAIGAGPAAEN